MGRFKHDDWVMSVTMFFYISLLILINISGRFATNLYLPEQEAEIFADPDQIRSRIIGSKIVIALEQCMLASTWGVKICILMFINRIVYKVPRLQLAVRFLAIYVVLSYLGVQLAYYGGICRPFKQYYAMPVHNQECATYSMYSKIQMVFNISSDVLLIALPIHMIWALQMRISQKVTLSMIFGLALFTILAAILNKCVSTFFLSSFTPSTPCLLSTKTNPSSTYTM
ncbi:hypothetical protein PVAG01_02685 [Phlyctema vagabunda]|uniref:Rhodopsin domain-containing protein n=1 Tax=Phlyctema vagabunda TaxID=108571 RepID=A0ABR4PRA5_9HELO